MEQRNKKVSKRSETKIIPPKKKRYESLSRDEVRSINKKRIKRRRKAKRMALLGVLALAVFSVGAVLVLSLFFKIGTVTVKGDKVYADKEVVAQSGIETGKNLIRVNEDEVNEALIKNLPYIGKVTVEKDLPDTVIITVTATREVAAFQWQSGFVLVDSDGKVLDKDASMLRDNVAIVNGVKIKNAVEGEIIELSDEKVTEEFIGLLATIKESGIDLITDITLDKSGEYELRYDGRITLKLGSTENAERKLKLAIAALKQENEINPYAEGVLDLKTPPNAYFKSGEETTAEAVTDENGETVPDTTKEESTTEKAEE